MKKRLSISVTVFVLSALLVATFPSQRVAAASATVTDIASPDSYTCGQTGYITFERMADGTNLSSGAIDGVQFTTTNGFTWLVGDFATGQYNGKYPSGGYTSQGTHWAWLGPNQGAGRIDFVNGPTSYFSLLVSNNLSPVQLDAYKADGTLLATAGPTTSNYSTGHMSELKIIRDTADVAYVVVHDTGNFFLVDAICTNASGVPNQALHDFKQNRNADGSKVAWADARLYNLSTCGTMEGYGCAITSLTDVIRSYGSTTLPNGASVDPGTVNSYLGLPENAGSHTGCGIYWAPAGRVLNYTISDYRPTTTSYEGRIARIDEALNANNLVIMGFPNGSNKHFIVLYQKAPNAPDGSPDYFIADPNRYEPYATGDRSGKTFYQAYNKTLKQIASSFQIDVVENKAPQPGKAWAIVAHSPVEMLITDPDGAQTGFNPVTNSYLLNMPESSYGVGDDIEDDTGANAPIPEVLYFGQNQVKNGIHKVEVIGTGTGPYTLDIVVASGPMDTSQRSIPGNARPGVIDTYFVSVAEGAPLSVKLQVNVDIKPGANPNPINLRSQGVIPLAIVSTATLDAATVDPLSVHFGPRGATAARYSLEDVNGDGLTDLVLHFRTQQIGIQVGDTQACLTGMTIGGLEIQGCDQIRVIR